MSKRRLARVNEQLKREISRIVRREVHDPRVGLVVVTGVDATADLSLARVHVRPSGEDPDWQEMMEGLEAAAPYIRRELGQDLHLHRIPELDFREDRTLEQAMRIEEILDEVLPEEEEDPGEADADEDDDDEAGASPA